MGVGESLRLAMSSSSIAKSIRTSAGSPVYFTMDFSRFEGLAGNMNGLTSFITKTATALDQSSASTQAVAATASEMATAAEQVTTSINEMSALFGISRRSLSLA